MNKRKRTTIYLFIALYYSVIAALVVAFVKAAVYGMAAAIAYSALQLFVGIKLFKTALEEKLNSFYLFFYFFSS